MKYKISFNLNVLMLEIVEKYYTFISNRKVEKNMSYPQTMIEENDHV